MNTTLFLTTRLALIVLLICLTLTTAQSVGRLAPQDASWQTELKPIQIVGWGLPHHILR